MYTGGTTFALGANIGGGAGEREIGSTSIVAYDFTLIEGVWT